MKNNLNALYKGLTSKRNMRLANTLILLLILIYVGKKYFDTKDTLNTAHRIEVRDAEIDGYLQGVSDGIEAKRDQRIEKSINEIYSKHK